jgi:hypothetical protein
VASRAEVVLGATFAFKAKKKTFSSLRGRTAVADDQVDALGTISNDRLRFQ